MNQNQKNLSLAMIVKDEEDCIKRCLDSVINLVDEIIIVDTGSTDKTIEICQSCNAQVFSYQWNNDFAAARNFGLDKVTRDWILWLDADEEVAENRNQINQGSLFDDYDALSIPIINFYGEKIDHDQVVQIGQPRLFRNHMGFRFENKVHEWLNLTSAYEQDRVGFLDLKIYHYGYMNSQVDNKQKFNRNVNLLLQELKDEEEAFLAYIKALMLANNFTPAREALDKLINTYPALANHAKHLKPEFKRLLSSETIL